MPLGSSVARLRGSHQMVGDRSASVIASILPVLTSLIALPILARTLSNGEFGLWALFMTAVTTIQLLDFGIGASVMRFGTLAMAAGDPQTAWRYWWTSCAAFLGMAATVALLAMIALPSVEFVGRRTGDDAALVMWLAFASILLAPASNTILVLLRALGRYRFSVLAVAAGQAAFLGVLLASVFLGETTLLVVLSAQAAQFATVIAAVLISYPTGLRPRFLRLARLGLMVNFGSKMMLVNLLNAGMLYGPLWVTSTLLSSAEAGVYAFASTVAIAVRNLPLMSVAPLFNKLANSGSRVWSVGQVEHLRWQKSVWLYVAFACPAVTIGAPLVGGDNYREAGALSALLVLGYGFGLATAVLSQALRVTNSAGAELLAWVWGATVMALILWPAVTTWGGNGAAVAAICGQMSACAAMHHYAAKRGGRYTYER